MRVLVAGASGFIGSRLRELLARDGHEVLRLVRGPARAGDERSWSPATGEIDQALVDSADAVVGLSGAPLDRLPWTRSYRTELRESRLTTTRTLARAIAASPRPPGVFLSASAVGIYGDRPGETLTEDAARGEGFLADLVEDWETVARTAPTRVVTLRTGVVVGHGGAFGILEPLTRAGLGANLGSGTQRWPWVSLHDEAAAIAHLLTSGLSGPVNLVGPTPATADAITRRLALALGRPRLFRIPRIAIEAGLRTPGRELLLADQRVVPERLQADGFRFAHATVEEAIRATWPGRPARA